MPKNSSRTKSGTRVTMVPTNTETRGLTPPAKVVPPRPKKK
jgi:hypothetical protein